ncbi:endonuclease/exonuclease/phosphatase family protein [Acrocarpospora macrocephala]|uniref:Endonuclease n=1 Tax=Acrocarpospora macrocephala TaxID=150177 RepID=A0A5M3X4G8_9ACTN|nr:endonuclease/exonuclease/phosphatase family protein [Acrocarpospora macrocephala]GES16044.1 endonuclease [Acrocarpospora macrocephala]
MVESDVIEVGGVIATPSREPGRGRRRLAWFLVVPCAVWALFQVAGLRFGVLGVMASSATPYVAVGALVAVLMAVLARARAAAVVGLLAAAGLLAQVTPRALAADQAPAAGASLRVLSINIMMGDADFGALLDLVRRLRPDVLSVQELTPWAANSLEREGLEEILPYTHLMPRRAATGGGLYSRFPLTILPEFAPDRGHVMPYARLLMPGAPPVDIAAVHPVNPVKQGTKQWRAGMASMPAAGGDAIRIMAGDFNATLDHPEFRQVLGKGYVDAAEVVGAGLIPTWPANWPTPPMITIDHVLVDSRVQVLAVDAHTIRDTDHRALFTELRLPASLS